MRWGSPSLPPSSPNRGWTWLERLAARVGGSAGVGGAGGTDRGDFAYFKPPPGAPSQGAPSAGAPGGAPGAVPAAGLAPAGLAPAPGSVYVELDGDRYLDVDQLAADLASDLDGGPLPDDDVSAAFLAAGGGRVYRLDVERLRRRGA